MPDDLVPVNDFAAQFADARRQVQLQHPQWAGRADDAAPRPFRALGHDRGRFFFWSAAGRQVISLKARDLHSAGELVQLAPLQWWEGEYPGRQGFDVKAAGDTMVQACYAAGVYDPDALRGRGVWLDQDRVVIHMGDRLIVDGAEVSLPEFQTKFIYEQARPLAIGIAEAMGVDEGKRLLSLCCEVAWENPDRDGRLMAGWLVTALICGGMAWRPHIWIISEAGGGKSWVLDNIIKPALRSLALCVQSKTSEAGIRGELGSDARPVLFDEAETQSDADRGRIQQILDLARQASTEDGGAIVKGTKDGGSRHYRIRSSFAFASINLGMSQAADESRTVALSIGAGTPEQFAELKRRHVETFTEGFAARLLARCLRLLPTIRANAEALADAISRTGAGRRAGDTLGTLMAGALALTSDARLGPEDAARFVANHEWVSDAAEAAKPEPEWRRALTRLLQAEGMVTTTNGRREALAVAELIACCCGRSEAVAPRDADMQLRRMTMRVQEGFLLIGNRSDAVARIFASTPWALAWGATLSRTPGAIRGKEARFLPMHKDKAVALPLSAMMGEDAG